MSHERRRHQRYPLRLAIKLHCRGQEMSANIINASASGCLLQMEVALEQGEVLEVSIPQLNMPKARLLVVRSESTSSGYMVATYFDQQVADEPSISRLSGEHKDGDSKPPETH